MINLKNIISEELLNDPVYLEAMEKALKEADAPVVETFEKSYHSILARPSGYWNNTGVYKPRGITLLVTYTGGTWRSNRHWGPVGAEGNSSYIAGGSYLRPGAPEGCLIGKVGGNSSAGGSETFAIGRHGYVSPDHEGLLWLSVNDETRGFGDNSGSISVSVSHV